MTGPQLCKIQVDLLWRPDKWNNKSHIWCHYEIQMVLWYVLSLIHATHCTDIESVWTAALQSRVISHNLTIRCPRFKSRVKGQTGWQKSCIFIWLNNIWSRLCNHYANVNGKQPVISTELPIHAASIFTKRDS